MAAQNGIDTAHAARELHIDIHAVMGEQHHRARALGTHGIDIFLQLGLLYAEGPIRDKMARVGDGRVRKRLANHRDGYTVDFA